MTHNLTLSHYDTLMVNNTASLLLKEKELRVLCYIIEINE